MVESIILGLVVGAYLMAMFNNYELHQIKDRLRDKHK